MGCGQAKPVDNSADLEKISQLEKANSDLTSKYKKADEELSWVTEQLKMCIIPRTVEELRELEERLNVDPEMGQTTWTHEDEQKVMADTELLAVLESAAEWTFDALKLDAATGGYPLPKLAWWLFKEHDLYSNFRIKPDKTFNFFRRIQARYCMNTYHNVIHGCDVGHAIHYWMRRGLLAENSTSLQIMSAIVASLCHDTGHPAKNNAFMVNSKNKLATLYNDVSVLENMHLALTFETYNHPDCDFLDNISKEEWTAFRKQAVSMILATDFGRHNEILSIAQERLKQGRLDLQKESDYDLTMKVGVKCADLRHCMMPHEMTKITTALLMEEFWAQGDAEAHSGLPISPFMNREKANLPKEQSGFYQFMIMPLIQVWAEMLPSEASVALDYSKRNWEAWQKMGKEKK